MGNLIGKTLKVDLTTSMQSRGKFARICVQVDLEKPLKAHYRLKNRHMKIEYEGIHLICFLCGKYGYEKDGCIQLVRPNVSKPQTSIENQQPTAAGNHGGTNVKQKEEALVDPAGDEGCYGPWMLVTINRRPRRSNANPNNAAGKEGQGIPIHSVKDVQQETQFPPHNPTKEQSTFN